MKSRGITQFKDKYLKNKYKNRISLKVKMRLINNMIVITHAHLNGEKHTLIKLFSIHLNCFFEITKTVSIGYSIQLH